MVLTNQQTYYMVLMIKILSTECHTKIKVKN
jgi:hypothetical protein